MQLSVKTLTGKVYGIEVDPSMTIAQVKAVIAGVNSEFEVEKQKLIHSGKVLKNEQILTECGVKEKDFLVVMITKPKRAAAPAPAPSPAAAAEPTPAPAAAAAPVAAAAAPPATTPTPAAPATSTTSPTPATPAPEPAAPAVSDADVAALRDMGFPEAEARAALEAANRYGGGPGAQALAVEFLMNGIPPNLPPPGAAAAQAAAAAVGGAAAGAAPAGAGTGALAELRNHPQFNQLRQLVQDNPAALEPVLQQIGAQSPQLLDAIRANTQEFLAMLNEPIAAAPAGGAPAPGGGMPAIPGMPAGGPTPAQMAALFAQLPDAERARLAQQFGMSPAQFGQLTQMMAQMSPDQLQQMMGMAGGQGGGMPGEGGMPPGGIPPGANVIRLTDEEVAAVMRLQQLGFSQQEAAEAYIACDKNEELAANFLFDSMGGGGGGFGGDFEPFPAAAAPAPAAAPAATPAAPAAAPAPATPAAPAPSTEATPAPAPSGDVPAPGDSSNADADGDEDMYN